jgi:hypothetical protein
MQKEKSGAHVPATCQRGGWKRKARGREATPADPDLV